MENLLLSVVVVVVSCKYHEVPVPLSLHLDLAPPRILPVFHQILQVQPSSSSYARHQSRESDTPGPRIAANSCKHLVLVDMSAPLSLSLSLLDFTAI
jgi:hypothetical protein